MTERDVSSSDSEPAPAARRSEWRFPSHLGSVTTMRWELRNLLGDTELSLNELEDLTLAVSEAATNAVEHPRDPEEPFFDVSIEVHGGGVTVVVQDHGHWRPRPDPGHGRGFTLMHALADTTVRTSPRGTTVTIRGRHAGARATTGQDERAS